MITLKRGTKHRSANSIIYLPGY